MQIDTLDLRPSPDLILKRVIALAWFPAEAWCPPRPSGGASSPSPDVSPARHAVLPFISSRTGPGKTSSATTWSDCTTCPFLTGLLPTRRTAQLPGGTAPGWASPAYCRNLPPDLAVARVATRKNPLPPTDTLSGRPNPSVSTRCRIFAPPFTPV